MNKVTWVIQTNLIALDQVQEIWDAAKNTGAEVREAIVIPFQDELGNEDQLPSAIGQSDWVVIPYGSCKMNKIAQARQWRGTCFDAETFRADVWNNHRSDMLNQSALFTTVTDAPRALKDVDDDQEMFIRPLFDLKEFAGTVCAVREIKRWMSSTASGNFSFSADTPIVIAPLQNIQGELRAFVVDGQVVSASWYRQAGQLRPEKITDPDVLALIQERANDWLPHSCCAMDLALTDSGWRVIEFNTINSSGFYACDISAIAKALTKWGQSLPPSPERTSKGSKISA